MRRAVTFRSGRSPGSRVGLTLRVLPIGSPTVDSSSKPRLQWRYRGGFSPPSLFSLGGHLNGQCLYVSAGENVIVPPADCQEGALSQIPHLVRMECRIGRLGDITIAHLIGEALHIVSPGSAEGLRPSAGGVGVSPTESLGWVGGAFKTLLPSVSWGIWALPKSPSSVVPANAGILPRQGAPPLNRRLSVTPASPIRW